MGGRQEEEESLLAKHHRNEVKRGPPSSGFHSKPRQPQKTNLWLLLSDLEFIGCSKKLNKTTKRRSPGRFSHAALTRGAGWRGGEGFRKP